MSENKTNTPAKNVLNQPISFSKKVTYPTKTRMNLYVRTQDEDTLKRLILVAILLLLVIAAFTKFGVIDRLKTLNVVRAQAAELEQKVADENAALESFAQIKEDYYRSTGLHLSDDEKLLRDRLQIMSVLNNAVGLDGTIDSYHITGNTAQISIRAESLEKVALISEALRANNLVNSVSMSRADREQSEEIEVVSASLIIGFKNAGEENQ